MNLSFNSIFINFLKYPGTAVLTLSAQKGKSHRGGPGWKPTRASIGFLQAMWIQSSLKSA